MSHPYTDDKARLIITRKGYLEIVDHEVCADLEEAAFEVYRLAEPQFYHHPAFKRFREMCITPFVEEEREESKRGYLSHSPQSAEVAG